MINNIKNEKIFSTNNWMEDVHPIKYQIRKLAHRVIGLHQIENRINSVIELLKVAQTTDSNSDDSRSKWYQD